MAGPSRSAHFEGLFESALQDYESKTGVSLAKHPLVVDLERCHSTDDITTLLQGRAQAFSKIPERDRMMKAIKATVSILIPLSDAPSLTDAFGPVRQGVLMASSTFLTFLQTSFPPVRAILVALGILLDVCAVLEFIYGYRCDIQVNQAANGILTSGEVLADLLESIEHFVERLSGYTPIPPTPTTNKILVKLIVELISTLAWVNRRLIRRRSREYFLAYM